MPPPMTASLTRAIVSFFTRRKEAVGLAHGLKTAEADMAMELVVLNEEERSESGGDLAVMLTGGGARAAYQVGLIKGLAKHFPHLQFQIITGVSAGAINAIFLASRKGLLA